MFSSFLFIFTVYNVNILPYENRDSSLILRIPDEPLCYVRWYRDKIPFVLTLHNNVSLLILTILLLFLCMICLGAYIFYTLIILQFFFLFILA